MMKNTLLIVGCGDIALRTAPILQARYRILGLCRNMKHLSQLRTHKIIPIYGDLDHPESLDKLAGIAQIILHLAPPASTDKRDKRTANLLSALTGQKTKHRALLPQRLLYISTSGVYGNCNGALIDETHPVKPGNQRAFRRIDAERQIRRWGIRNHVNTSILRVPGIYAMDRLPLARIRASNPALSAADDNYTNHIHADDLAQIIWAALRHARPGRIYHTCDDSHLKMGDYFDLVADQYNLPRPPRISLKQANKCIPASMLSFMQESRRLKNNRMKHELHVSLQYPTVLDGIKADQLIDLEK